MAGVCSCAWHLLPEIRTSLISPHYLFGPITGRPVESCCSLQGRKNSLLVKQPMWVPQIRPGTGSCHDGWSSTFSRLDEPKQLPPSARRGSQSSLETELVAGNAQQQGTCTNRARFIIIYPIQNVLWTPLQLLQKRKVPVGGPATATRHHTVRRGIVGR